MQQVLGWFGSTGFRFDPKCRFPALHFSTDSTAPFHSEDGWDVQVPFNSFGYLNAFAALWTAN